MADKDTAMVIFQPSGRRGEVPKGINIIEASRLLGVDIEALCGEKKVCGKCIVRIEEGHFEKYNVVSSIDNVSPWQEEEAKFIYEDRKKTNHRLACVAKVEGDLLVFVPEESRAGKQVVSKKARDIHIDLNPSVKIYHVEVVPPTFEEPLGDFERICAKLEEEHGLKDLKVDIECLRQLPVALREGDWKVTVSIWNDQEMIRVRPGKHEAAYGIAIDTGTTTVAGYFCNLVTGEVLDTVTLMNPQCKFGEDVMARITFHMTTDDGLKRMSDDLVEGLNWLIDQALKSTYQPIKKVKKEVDGEKVVEEVEAPEEGKTYLRLKHEDIEDITLGFNTVMHHIFLGLDPQYVGLSPFPPAIQSSMYIRARDLGLKIHPSA